MARSISKALLAATFAAALLAFAAETPAQTAKVKRAPAIKLVSPESCPQLPVDPAKINDYRGRNASEWIKWTYEDNWKSHTGPAVERIQSGEYTHRVMADLAFTLWGWPNHVIALQALIDYTMHGGKSYEFMPTECYFVHAKRFHADDPAVPMLEGLFYWRLKQFDEAKRAYHTALELSPDSTDAHYNLGLIYLELKDYDAAVKHAQVAYRAGYPLAGLRKKLQDLGRWREPSAG